VLRAWLHTPRPRGKVRDERVLRMFLLSALDPADARVVLTRIADSSAQEAATLRRVRAEAGPVGPGPEAFGQLAAEFGLRQFEAVHGWALWAIDQLDARQPSSAR
jgi:hypothetical protein